MVVFVDWVGFEKLPFYSVTNVFLFVLNFVFTDIYVFRDKRKNEPRLRYRFFKFVIGKGGGLFINVCSFEVATMLGAGTVFATVVGGGVGMVINFIVSKHWIYAKKKLTGTAEPGE
jgi:putative flippase GtrA